MTPDKVANPLDIGHSALLVKVTIQIADGQHMSSSTRLTSGAAALLAMVRPSSQPTIFIVAGLTIVGLSFLIWHVKERISEVEARVSFSRRGPVLRPVAIALATVALVGCAGGGVGGALSASTEVAGSVTETTNEPSSSYDSVLELLDAKDLAEYDESEQILLELIMPPTAFTHDLRLAGIQVDDPNGDGRIDDRWYPPRVVMDECSIRTDQAPMPRAGASYIPGDPGEEPAGQFETSQTLLEAPYVIGVTIQVFDTAEQRDGMADTMAEFYATVQGDDVVCGLNALFGDVEQVEPFDVGHPGFGFVTEPMGGSSKAFFYSIGDRLLLTVGLSGGGLFAEDDADEPADDLLERAVQAQVTWLEAAALPSG